MELGQNDVLWYGALLNGPLYTETHAQPVEAI
jgi:hypothetical protein